MTTTTTIIREETDEEIEIEAEYRPGRRATYENPGDPAEVEILSAFIGNEEVELTSREEEEAKDKIFANPPYEY